jgi:MFS family permease
MVADVVPEEHRSSVFAVFYTSINIAVVAGPIIGGIFYERYRFELLLAAAFSCLFLVMVLTKGFVRPCLCMKTGISFMEHGMNFYGSKSGNIA